MSDHQKRKVLFLCTGNSARSILGEYLLRAMDPRFETFSAGAEPTGKVHPVAVKVLREVYGIDASSAESKSWQSMADLDLDLVITVCGHARDTCPLSGSTALVIHWGSEDPARAGDDEAEAVFRRVAAEIHDRLERLCALPWDRRQLGEMADELRRIGSESVPA